jgi:hypothetical protein
MFPFLLKLYADSGYQGSKFQLGLKHVCRQINLDGTFYVSGAHLLDPA